MLAGIRGRHLVISIGIILSTLTAFLAAGCGGGIGSWGDNDNDGTLPLIGNEGESENYQIVAEVVEGDPQSRFFKVVASNGSSGTGLTFTWDFGDGQTHAGPEQTYAFPGPGQYVVSMTARRNNDTVAFVLTLGIEIPAPNETPLADAGGPQSVNENDMVFLFGAESSDPEGAPLTYLWRQLAGTAVLLVNDDEATANFVAPMVVADSELTFALAVGDGELTAQDTAVVTVLNVVDDPGTIDPASLPPVANAGPDQTVTELTSVFLDGGQSTGPPGSTLVYLWIQLSGPTVTLQNENQSVANFLAPSAVGQSQVLVFQLRVTAGSQAALDTVNVTVNPPPPPDPCSLDGDGDGTDDCADGCPSDPQKIAPGACGCGIADVDANGNGVPDCDETPTVPPLVAGAGLDRSIILGGSAILTGSASGGAPPYSFRWSPTTGLNNPLIVQPTAAPSSTTTYTLTVTDSGARTAADSVVVTVQLPALVANAGADRTIASGSSTTLSGAATGGQAPYTYRWSPTTGLSNANIAQPTANPTTTTTYTLTATDAQLLTASDSVVVTVQPPPLVAGAGPDRTITAGSSTTLPGSASGGVSPYTYRWSPTTALSNANIAQPTATPSVTTTYTLTVTDAQSATAADSVVVTVQALTPILATSAQNLNFGASGTSLTFQVWNSGGGTLGYTITDDAAWLSVSPASGDSTGEHDTIAANVVRTALPDATYNAVITVRPGVGTAATILVSMTVGSSGAPMSTASRSTGVAPLAVIFDAVQAGSGVTAPPLVDGRRDYASYHYQWDFADNASATWQYSGKRKNEAVGFVAAHVFETAGSYRVTLRVTDPSGSTQVYEQTITVQDPEVVYANSSNDTAERTYYMAANGDDANNGSFNRPFRTWSFARGRLFASSGPRRLLLRRGDAFTHSSGSTVSSRVGPFTIGAYPATGAKPVITSTDSSSGILTLDVSATDIRMMDIDMVGNVVGQAVRPGVDTLVLRCGMSNFGNGVSTSEAHGLKQRVFLVDNVIENNDRYGIYFNFGQHVSFLGNLIDDVNGEHLCRCYITHSLIEHNNFRGGHPAKHQLKFVGYFPTGAPERAAATPTEEVEFSIISDNIFEQPDSGVDWMAVLGPVDNSKNQRMRDVVFERNTMRSDVGTGVMLYGNNRYITVRNNVFDGTLTPGVTAIRITRRGVEPDPLGYTVYNNTMYSGNSSGSFTCVQIDNMASQTTVRNNLGSAPNGEMIGDGGTALVADFNLFSNAPGFVNAGARDFRLAPGSPAIDAGVALPHVLEDIQGTRRPVNGDGRLGAEQDLGANERVP